MFLTNGFKAELVQYNRQTSSLAYDDEDKITKKIKVIPYDVGEGINFGTYSTPNASGSFIIRREVDAKEGDQIIINGKTFTIQEVDDEWIYNRVEYKVVKVR